MDIGSESRVVLEQRGGAYNSKFMNDLTSQVGVCTVTSIPDTKSKEDISGECLPRNLFLL